MANNRYYLYCPKCRKYIFIGKSFGTGIYTYDDSKELQLERIYYFMWQHLIHCYHGENYTGKLFSVITEGDKRYFKGKRISDEKLNEAIKEKEREEIKIMEVVRKQKENWIKALEKSLEKEKDEQVRKRIQDSISKLREDLSNM